MESSSENLPVVDDECNDRNSKCVEKVSKWILTNAPFRGRTDTDFILKFLHGCKFSVEKTKLKMTKYYEIRKKYPKIVTKRDFQEENILKLINQCFIMYDVKGSSKKSPVICTADFSKLTLEDDMKSAVHLAVIIAECALLEERLKKFGVVIIMNANLLTKHILQCTPRLINAFVQCFLNALPIRVKAINIINVNRVVIPIINILKTFLSAKLRGRIHLYNKSWESVYDHVPLDCLPPEYGGTGWTIEENLEALRDLLSQSRDYLLDDERYGYIQV